MAVQFDEKQFVFKAWTEKTGSEEKIKLHVHGQVAVEDETLLYQLDKKTEQGDFSEELFLVIRPEPIPGKNIISVQYHENINNVNRYKKVTIITKTGQIFEIQEIGIK